MGAERKNGKGTGCRVGDAAMDRVRLSVELQGGMVRQYRIRRQLGGNEKRIDRIRYVVAPRRDDGIEPAPNPNDAV